MPRGRGRPRKTRGTGRRPQLKKSSSSSDHEDNVSDGENQLGMLSSLLTWIIQSGSGKKRRAPKRRRPTDNDCENQCQCCHCTKKTPRRRTATKPKRGKETKAATSTRPEESIEIESETEATGSVVQTHSDNIKDKVDKFFKALESDEEESEGKRDQKASNIPPEKKTKEFYTLLTDSEDEKDEVQVGSIVSSPKPSTSRGQIGGLPKLSNNPNLNLDKKTEDLFAYVDEVLKECSEVVDLSDSKSIENVPVLSMEDMKKKTDELLGGVASLLDDLTPKPKESKKKPEESPAKEAPICPICLEQLGGSRQAMATLCGHMFCEPCLLAVVTTTKKCPSCRKGVTKTKYHPVYI